MRSQHDFNMDPGMASGRDLEREYRRACQNTDQQRWSRCLLCFGTGKRSVFAVVGVNKSVESRETCPACGGTGEA